jgi:hypothetical protein
MFTLEDQEEQGPLMWAQVLVPDAGHTINSWVKLLMSTPQQDYIRKQSMRKQWTCVQEREYCNQDCEIAAKEKETLSYSSTEDNSRNPHCRQDRICTDNFKALCLTYRSWLWCGRLQKTKKHMS